MLLEARRTCGDQITGEIYVPIQVVTPGPYAGNHPAFLDALFEVIKTVEQGRTFNQYVHDDGKRVPTIGYGYALLVVKRWPVGDQRFR